MKTGPIGTLPGFQTFNAFFADLEGDFEPIQLSDKENAAFLKALASIDGAAKMEFRELREDLELTARIREARRYADGRTFVRVEFRHLEETDHSCSSAGQPCGFAWTGPYQLMAAFDSAGALDSYTVLPGRDVLPEGLEFAVTSKEPGPLHYDTTDDVAFVLDRLTSGFGWREVIIYDKATHGHLANLHGFGKGKGFLMYWRLGCNPWHMNASDMTLSQVEACLRALGTGGIKALEEAIAWEVRTYEETPVRVDEMLWRSLELAKLQDDEIKMRTIHAVGVDDEWVEERFRFLDIASGTWEEMQERIYEKACGLSDRGKAAKLFTLLALRGHVESCKRLSLHFESEADYDLADYWSAQAATLEEPRSRVTA